MNLFAKMLTFVNLFKIFSNIIYIKNTRKNINDLRVAQMIEEQLCLFIRKNKELLISENFNNNNFLKGSFQFIVQITHFNFNFAVENF